MTIRTCLAGQTWCAINAGYVVDTAVNETASAAYNTKRGFIYKWDAAYVYVYLTRSVPHERVIEIWDMCSVYTVDVSVFECTLYDYRICVPRISFIPSAYMDSVNGSYAF